MSIYGQKIWYDLYEFLWIIYISDSDYCDSGLLLKLEDSYIRILRIMIKNCLKKSDKLVEA